MFAKGQPERRRAITSVATGLIDGTAPDVQIGGQGLDRLTAVRQEWHLVSLLYGNAVLGDAIRSLDIEVLRRVVGTYENNYTRVPPDIWTSVAKAVTDRCIDECGHPRNDPRFLNINGHLVRRAAQALASYVDDDNVLGIKRDLRVDQKLVDSAFQLVMTSGKIPAYLVQEMIWQSAVNGFRFAGVQLPNIYRLVFDKNIREQELDPESMHELVASKIWIFNDLAKLDDRDFALLKDALLRIPEHARSFFQDVVEGSHARRHNLGAFTVEFAGDRISLADMERGKNTNGCPMSISANASVNENGDVVGEARAAGILVIAHAINDASYLLDVYGKRTGTVPIRTPSLSHLGSGAPRRNASNVRELNRSGLVE